MWLEMQRFLDKCLTGCSFSVYQMSVLIDSSRISYHPPYVKTNGNPLKTFFFCVCRCWCVDVDLDLIWLYVLCLFIYIKYDLKGSTIVRLISKSKQIKIEMNFKRLRRIAQKKITSTLTLAIIMLGLYYQCVPV